MIGIGTIVNVLAIIVGSTIGIIAKKGLSERFQDQIMKTLGLATMFIGIGCTMQEMLSVTSEGKLSADGIMMMIISLVIGSIIGELLRIEDRLEGIGDKNKAFQGRDEIYRRSCDGDSCCVRRSNGDCRITP